MKYFDQYQSDIHDRLLRSIDFEDSVAIDRLKQAVLKAVLVYYATHTAKETCELFGIPFTREYVKILHHLHPKGLGLGGARKGAGRNKISSQHQ